MGIVTGERVGPYVIEGAIGAGSFGTVFQAHDPRFDDTVAIKVLAENHSLHPGLRERFAREGHLLRRARSSAVLQVYDCGQTPAGQPYLVMECAAGGTLAERRAGVDSIGIGDIRTLAMFLARAMAAVHDTGSVHRDLSPANVLITNGPSRVVGAGEHLLADGERLVLADMGSAKDLRSGSGLTTGVGTLGFRAPEQATPITVVDQRADIYSATAIVAWAISGTVPPDGDWSPALAQLGSGPLREALEFGLQPDPDCRPDGTSEWYGMMLDATGPVPTATVTSRPRGRNSRPSTWLGAVAALIVGLAAGWSASRLVVSDDGPENSQDVVGEAEPAPGPPVDDEPAGAGLSIPEISDVSWRPDPVDNDKLKIHVTWLANPSPADGGFQLWVREPGGEWWMSQDVDETGFTGPWAIWNNGELEAVPTRDWEVRMRFKFADGTMSEFTDPISVPAFE